MPEGSRPKRLGKYFRSVLYFLIANYLFLERNALLIAVRSQSRHPNATVRQRLASHPPLRDHSGAVNDVRSRSRPRQAMQMKGKMSKGLRMGQQGVGVRKRGRRMEMMPARPRLSPTRPRRSPTRPRRSPTRTRTPRT
jgi:hypothetical protein